MKRASYREGVEWIAVNDEPAETDINVIAELISTVLLADLFGKDPMDVARAVLKVRVEQYKISLRS